MTRTLALALIAFSSVAYAAPRNDNSSVPPQVAEALNDASAVINGKVHVSRFTIANRTQCIPDKIELKERIDGSGRVPVRYTGKDKSGADCQAWAWADVQVWAPVLITTRAVKPGETIDGAVTEVEREVMRGHEPLTQVTPGLIATNMIASGAVIEKHAVHIAQPKVGTQISVTIVAGGVTVEEAARVLPCVPDRVCVMLPSGKRLDGTMQDGHLLVEAP
jgi:flagella basal body P-ring formation protein FlgA